jgi:predicted transcriptional regulator
VGGVREFGQLERAVMDVIWSADRPQKVREVRERLCYARPVAYTTVMTVMDILHGKGSCGGRSRAARGCTGRPRPGKTTTPG